MLTQVFFRFDEHTIRLFNKVTRRGGFTSWGSVVRENIEIRKMLNENYNLGFTQLLVRNNEIGKEKRIFIPSMRRSGFFKKIWRHIKNVF